MYNVRVSISLSEVTLIAHFIYNSSRKAIVMDMVKGEDTCVKRLSVYLCLHTIDK